MRLELDDHLVYFRADGVEVCYLNGYTTYYDNDHDDNIFYLCFMLSDSTANIDDSCKDRLNRELAKFISKRCN